MTHEIIKRGPKDYYCTVCEQTWTSESKAHCPRMRVISYADRGPLMSKTEMDKRGYKTDALPKSTCCYRMNTANNDVLYVKLYDPSECALKPQRKHKILHYIDSLHWPLAWGSFLDAMTQWESENKRGEHIRVWRAMCLDLGRMVSPLLTFTPDEIALFAGETVEFKFPLIPVRSEWTERQVSVEQAETLADILLREYRNYQWRNRPAPTDEELEERRIKQEERNKRGLEIVNRELKERFALPDWVTPAEMQSPATQRPLWDELESVR